MLSRQIMEARILEAALRALSLSLKSVGISSPEGTLFKLVNGWGTGPALRSAIPRCLGEEEPESDDSMAD